MIPLYCDLSGPEGIPTGLAGDGQHHPGIALRLLSQDQIATIVSPFGSFITTLSQPSLSQYIGSADVIVAQ